MLLSIDYENIGDNRMKAVPSKRDKSSTKFLKYLEQKGEIIERFGEFAEHLAASDIIIFTVGSALNYMRSSMMDPLAGKVDFHKLSSEEWHELFTIDEIANHMKAVLTHIKHFNPAAQIYVTLSPIPIKGYKSKP